MKNLADIKKKSERWKKNDAAYHLHPFANTKKIKEEGCVVVTHAEGGRLWDSDGNKIIDGISGMWCVNVGYGRNELADVAARQMEKLPYYNTFYTTSHPPVIGLSEKLAEVTPPGFNHFFYCNSGSESVDTALRIVTHYWQALHEPSRKYVIGRINGYHGSTIAGAALGGIECMHQQLAFMPDNFIHIEEPYWYAKAEEGVTPETFGLDCARKLEEKIIELGAENVAAFIGEPFQGAGGVIIPPETYWPEIQRICKKYSILLVADEVIGGFGRLGEWFSHQYFVFEPDIMTLAKGLTSGYMPMGAVAIQDRIANVFADAGDFYHGMTYSGHPVAAAVATENIKILQRENIVDYVKHSIGPYFQKVLREALGNSPVVGEIHGVGMVAGIQLCRDKSTRTRFINGDDIAIQCRSEALSNHLIIRASGDRLMLSPGLTSDPSFINELVDKVSQSLNPAIKAL